MPELKETKGFQYLENSRFDRTSIQNQQRPAIARVETFKRYPPASRIPLPRTWSLDEERITLLLQNRRSLRKYRSEPLNLEHFAFMLWASQGITGQAGSYLFRATPSAGALYPVETYISVHSVEGLDAGLYHFDVEHFALDRLTDQDKAEDVAQACLNQTFMSQAAAVFLWTGVFRRAMSKYGDRGMRYVLLDAGHICQNVMIAAEAVDCGGCPIGAFYDSELNQLLQIDGEEESILYAASVGRKFLKGN
ncbi:MAG: SagB/ThcOx family dehydrogenase [Proteobacteria bacterium]|jgi:SagB-type dehydrogenase family enzyme|nr:SagB/ThcOx family dehydrogenase [Desulfocapsa sp.]MBU3946265.1 SagB/ThcOx family dehydrogenase [Pseudomonadota bacterium]MCG2742477.1 SagB/ThcOx family dehydrogenase [Desulfobacteraceae bacterium]MBU3984264.1 SagB/ThcOx family dehydrogenase [Pseudomonadota bacterium]MBU4044420.1 SagB/ThcOx family dehydrogenase [Pseudomonadota bacterium]